MEEIKESIFKKPWMQSLVGIVLILLVVFGVLFYKSMSSYVEIEDGSIEAPVISISSESTGILDKVYVKIGDNVLPGDILAQVGADVLRAKVAGTIIYISNTPGQLFSPSVPVIKMIDKNELRVIGKIKEDSGFSDISIGDVASFTLDAYTGEKYTGIVDEVSETSDESSVVFSISDKREVKDFTIKIKYDTAAYDFKNGMSAKIKVYTK